MLGLSQEVSDRTETSPKVSVNPLLAHHDSLGSTLILFESSWIFLPWAPSTTRGSNLGEAAGNLLAVGESNPC